MNEGEQLGMRVGLDRMGHGFSTDRLAPFEGQKHNRGSSPLGDFRHAATENAVLGDDGGVSGFQQIDESGFHGKRSGCRDREKSWRFFVWNA